MRTAVVILQLWRELERQLESADDDDREDLHARIYELRDLYQGALDDVYDIDAASARPGRPGRSEEGQGPELVRARRVRFDWR